MPRRAALLVAALAAVLASAETPAADRKLTREVLFSDVPPISPVAMHEFAPPADAQPPLAEFEGRLALSQESRLGSMRIVHDGFKLAVAAPQVVGHLPEFDFEFVSSGDALIPVRRGTIENPHPHWEFILEPGRLWSEPADGGLTRAALPFSLQERNANCVHNGVLTFLFDAEGRTSRVFYVVASETCFYLKVDLWGALPARYRPGTIADREGIVEAYQREIAARLPTRPLADLARDYPGADVAAFGNPLDIAPSDMVAFGFVIDGVHYVGGCDTRVGPYPFCDVLNLPSYSLAKSLVAGLGTMALARERPGLMGERVDAHVRDCASKRWDGVTLGHVADMATGNFDSAVYDEDEQSEAMGKFFVADDHATRIAFACDHWPRRAAPGTRWVYHTTDTYVLGTALQALVKGAHGPQADFYSDVIVDRLWDPLELSPVLRQTRRSRDRAAQPFTGWGLTMHRDDIARIGVFLLEPTPTIANEPAFDGPSFARAMQRNPADRGIESLDASFRYAQGFWAHDVAPYLGCKAPTWVPYMAGYGGIDVVLLPNGTVYYYFSDGGAHRWARAAVASHRIRPYCAEPAAVAP